jgi:U3 small nucleolar RNA-associated protein 20
MNLKKFQFSDASLLLSKQQSAGIFMRYLLAYPMGEDRFEQHMKQVVLNMKYEFREGRLSAVNLASMVIEKLPAPALGQHAHLFFLPLVLQMVNDDSKECREAVANCLSLLLSRCSTDLLQSFYDYTVRWSKAPGPLQATSLQLFGIFVDSRADFLRKGDGDVYLVGRLQELLEGTHTDWEIPYFSLICVEKLSKSFASVLQENTDLWTAAIKCMVNSHPWIKLASGRLVNNYLLAIDSESLDMNGAKNILLKKSGLLFQITRNLCFQLNNDEEEQTTELSELAIKSLSWILPVMHKYPNICYAKGELPEDENEGRHDPVLWLMTRLSNIAKPKGNKRREAVFKCFAAFIALHPKIVFLHLELMLEPLHRVSVEASNVLDNPAVAHKPNQVSEVISAQASLARDVLQLLEESCGSTEEFLRAYAVVKTRARDKKDQRKTAEKAEAVRDPQAATKRKTLKHDQDKKRHKRRVEEKRRGRGAVAKRRNMGS